MVFTNYSSPIFVTLDRYTDADFFEYLIINPLNKLQLRSDAEIMIADLHVSFTPSLHYY